MSVRPRARAALFAAPLLALALAARADAFDTTAREAILVDHDTGTVLLERDADKPVPPASMSKLMTVYMVFERLRDGRMALDDMLPVSEKAWRTGGSKMFVEVDTTVSVEDLLRGIIVQSGNDACVVIAEAVSGTEEAFAAAMNERAREIGLRDSHFVNSSGLPDPAHVMSARDLARLTGRLVREFPEYFPYFAETEFTYGGIRQDNRNPLLYMDIGADGMKTGYTEAAGYSLAGSAARSGRRLILAITGLDSARARSGEAARLIGWGFRETDNYTLFSAGEEIETARVWLGVRPGVPLVLEDDLAVTLSREGRDGLEVSVELDSPVPAPIAAGAEIATLRVAAPGLPALERPLRAAAAVERTGAFGRVWAVLRHAVFGPDSP